MSRHPFGMGSINRRALGGIDSRGIEAYYQEAGRAGRDGLTADAWMTYGLAVGPAAPHRRVGGGRTFKRVSYRKLDAWWVRGSDGCRRVA